MSDKAAFWSASPEALLAELHSTAVGLTPQLLPAIVSVNLAHGARRMAERKVIVKRLAATGHLGPVGGAICQEVIDVLAVLNALPPKALHDL